MDRDSRSWPVRRWAAGALTAAAQVLVLSAFWLAGSAIARWTGWPLPGGILGMFLLLAALATGLIPARAVERGAHLLLGEMLLFFVPAVLVILDHRELLGWTGLTVAGIVAASTLFVMTATGLTMERLARRGGGDEGDAGR